MHEIAVIQEPLPFGGLGFARLGKRSVHFRCFLGSQIFNRTEVKLMNERIGLLQNMLKRSKLDPMLYQ